MNDYNPLSSERQILASKNSSSHNTFPEAAPHRQKDDLTERQVILYGKRLHSFREGKRIDQ